MHRLVAILVLLLPLSCMSRPKTKDPSTPEATATKGYSTSGGSASRGSMPVTVYEGYMSPTQQPGEETDAPKALEKALGLEGTGASIPREERKSKGYGKIQFARDLSVAFVDIQIEGVNPADIVMFHIHCGPPGFLGPIIVDFGEFGDLTKMLESGKFSVELRNKDITFIKDMPRGLKPSLPESCPADLGFLTQSKTIASLEYLARKGVLYFNLHTKNHSFYGEMRGQIYSEDK